MSRRFGGSSPRGLHDLPRRHADDDIRFVGDLRVVGDDDDAIALLVREALKRAGRTDLIGHGSECLVRPEGRRDVSSRKKDTKRSGKRKSGPAK